MASDQYPAVLGIIKQLAAIDPTEIWEISNDVVTDLERYLRVDTRLVLKAGTSVRPIRCDQMQAFVHPTAITTRSIKGSHYHLDGVSIGVTLYRPATQDVTWWLIYIQDN